jgi:HSP20 family protein
MLQRHDAYRDFDRLTARVFDSTTRPAGARLSATRPSATRPSGARLDAYRDGDSFVIDIDLPGLDPAGIDVSVDHQVLTVRAERKRVQRDGAELVVAERPMGPVSRQVVLSDALDTDRLEAKYDTGVLTLTIPVTAKGAPRRFEVAA